MLLSKKVLDEYKRRFNSDLQVEKDTRVALREQAIFFGLAVQLASRAAKDKAKRKAFKLTDVVNGAVSVVQTLVGSGKGGEWIDDIFKAPVDVTASGQYTDAAFSELVVSGLFTKEAGSNTINIDFFNSLRISEIESMLKTPRKASRNTNAFLAKAITKYIFYLLQEAEAQASAEKKKRITRQHLKIVPVTTELSEVYAKFNAGKGAADDTADEDADGDNQAAVKKSVTISPKDEVRIMPTPGPEYSVAPGPVAKREAPSSSSISESEPPVKKVKTADDDTAAAVKKTTKTTKTTKAKVGKAVTPPAQDEAEQAPPLPVKVTPSTEVAKTEMTEVAAPKAAAPKAAKATKTTTKGTKASKTTEGIAA